MHQICFHLPLLFTADIKCGYALAFEEYKESEWFRTSKTKSSSSS
jgi:hypothetical protein